MNLESFFKENPKVALAFSGGVDSSALLYAAVSYGAQVQAYYVKTPFQPDFELRDAQRLADQLGVKMKIIEKDILLEDKVRANLTDRCYYCKRAILTEIKEVAMADGFKLLLDGSNASDDPSDRLGMKALEEMEVRSPLRESGLDKAAVRKLALEGNLFTWDKPAYACLATRIPTGEEITLSSLEKIEKAEDILFALGYSDFRLRLMEGAARLLFPREQMARAFAQREEIVSLLEEFFSVILLDLKGRENTDE